MLEQRRTPVVTLRDHLEAIRKLVQYYDDGLTPREKAINDRVDAAIESIEACDTPGKWWVEGQGIITADYRVRMLPDPLPGEPDPQAPWSPS